MNKDRKQFGIEIETVVSDRKQHAAGGIEARELELHHGDQLVTRLIAFTPTIILTNTHSPISLPYTSSPPNHTPKDSLHHSPTTTNKTSEPFMLYHIPSP